MTRRRSTKGTVSSVRGQSADASVDGARYACHAPGCPLVATIRDPRVGGWSCRQHAGQPRGLRDAITRQIALDLRYAVPAVPPVHAPSKAAAEARAALRDVLRVQSAPGAKR